LVVTVVVIIVNRPLWLVAALVLGLLLRMVIWKNLSAALRSALPVVLFAVVLVVMQWLAAVPVTILAAKVLAVFLFSTAAFRLLPWTDAFATTRPGSTLHGFFLYLLFVRHFVIILQSEASRVLHARALCLARPYGRGALASLVWGLVSLFSRSLVRAERFYAAQLLRGFGE
jgi:hypothetical protein